MHHPNPQHVSPRAPLYRLHLVQVPRLFFSSETQWSATVLVAKLRHCAHNIPPAHPSIRITFCVMAKKPSHLSPSPPRRPDDSAVGVRRDDEAPLMNVPQPSPPPPPHRLAIHPQPRRSSVRNAVANTDGEGFNSAWADLFESLRLA